MVTETTSFDQQGGTGLPGDGLPGGFRQCGCCAAIAYPGDAYCASCGHALAPPIAERSIRTCLECGATIRNRIAFHCIRCGASLRERDHT